MIIVVGQRNLWRVLGTGGVKGCRLDQWRIAGLNHEISGYPKVYWKGKETVRTESTPCLRPLSNLPFPMPIQSKSIYNNPLYHTLATLQFIHRSGSTNGMTVAINISSLRRLRRVIIRYHLWLEWSSLSSCYNLSLISWRWYRVQGSC